MKVFCFKSNVPGCLAFGEFGFQETWLPTMRRTLILCTSKAHHFRGSILMFFLGLPRNTTGDFCCDSAWEYVQTLKSCEMSIVPQSAVYGIVLFLFVNDYGVGIDNYPLTIKHGYGICSPISQRVTFHSHCSMIMWGLPEIGVPPPK